MTLLTLRNGKKIGDCHISDVGQTYISPLKEMRINAFLWSWMRIDHGDTNVIPSTVPREDVCYVITHTEMGGI